MAAEEGGTNSASIMGQPPIRYGAKVRTAVATARRTARPGAAVVVVGRMATYGWSYYLFDYAGSAVDTGPRISPSRVLLATTPASRSETAFLRRTQPSEIFLYFTFGTSAPQTAEVVGRFNKTGYCHAPKQAWNFQISGLLLAFDRC